ncbi:MAG TPA: glycoside hydrolase family 30 beta sandwich domain-containing protein, partial [Xylanibacter oryzae]|nr:glycoside hydrolase family 30 beta sandwich domain-containing protein [Xylanibacter oryzae]
TLSIPFVLISCIIHLNFGSAYLNTDGKWVVVAINYSEQSKPFALSLDNSESIKWKMYRTSDVTSENLTPVDTYDASNCNLTPRSITTFVSE